MDMKNSWKSSAETTSDELELLTRKSEQEIRKQKYDVMVAEPYEVKLERTKNNIRTFVDALGIENVYVSTSGGKDSAVLVDIAKKLYPNIKLIMFNTGLEYQCTIELAKKQDAEIMQPKYSWKKIGEEIGYPVVSKEVSERINQGKKTPNGIVMAFFCGMFPVPNVWLHFFDDKIVDFKISKKCCDYFKKKPAKETKLNPMIATRTEESRLRQCAWKRTGCNAFALDYSSGKSTPLALWTSKDIERYIAENNVELSDLYTKYGAKRTGCMMCPYGSQYDGHRFDMLKKLEPKRYEFFMNTKLKEILALQGTEIESDIEYTFYKNSVQMGIEQWHIENSKNKYLDWKCKWALEHYTLEQIMKELNHYKTKKDGIWKYPYDEIVNKLNEIERSKK